MENALKFCKMGRGGKHGGDRATVVLRARLSTEAEWGVGRWAMDFFGSVLPLPLSPPSSQAREASLNRSERPRCWLVSPPPESTFEVYGIVGAASHLKIDVCVVIGSTPHEASSTWSTTLRLSFYVIARNCSGVCTAAATASALRLGFPAAS